MWIPTWTNETSGDVCPLMVGPVTWVEGVSEEKRGVVYVSSRNRHDDTGTSARSSFLGNMAVSLSKLCDRGVCTEPTQVCLSQSYARCGATLDTGLFPGVKVWIHLIQCRHDRNKNWSLPSSRR